MAGTTSREELLQQLACEHDGIVLRAFEVADTTAWTHERLGRAFLQVQRQLADWRKRYAAAILMAHGEVNASPAAKVPVQQPKPQPSTNGAVQPVRR